MGFDVRAPAFLQEAQLWMASIITRPIDMDNNMHPISPSGVSMEEEAPRYVMPSPTLRPHQRIEIYNQQYWWRLLNILHDMFPLVVRLFGYADFNQTIGFPYLVKYPPNHWSLNTLGKNFCRWVREEYVASDQQLVYDAATLDWGYDQSFVAEELPRLEVQNEGALDAFATKKLFLQPSLFIFAFGYDLLKFREEMVQQEPEYWIDNDFPHLDKGEHHFAVARTPAGYIGWYQISEAEYLLLNRFRAGASITEACQWLEKQHPSIVDQALEHIQQWFQEWVARGWFSLKKETSNG